MTTIYSGILQKIFLYAGDLIAAAQTEREQMFAEYLADEVGTYMMAEADEPAAEKDKIKNRFT